MIVERHYDDEALIAILGIEGDRSARDPHLVVCSSCADNLSSYRAIADVLGSDAVWDLKDLRRDSAPDSVGVLRAFAARLNNEDESAEDLVADLLSRPRAQWLTTVQSDERFVNAGVVRLLVEKSEQTISKTPPEAMAMIRAAVDVAERLDSQQLRGAAWRQYAYALFYTGDYTNATDAVDIAQTAFAKCSVADYELARVGIVRALIYTLQERYGDAYAIAQQVSKVFRAYGDRDRLARAMDTQAFSLLMQSRYAEALPVLLDVDRNFQDVRDADSRALTLGNIALCWWQTGKLAEAFGYYKLAEDLYQSIGSKSEATRVRMNVASVLASQGHYAEAKKRIRDCQREYDEFGMRTDSADAGLALAEILLVEKAFVEAEALCRRAIEQYQASGVSHTAYALTALTYLREAAAQRRATPEVVRQVKTYLERLHRQPSLQFAPPPLPPE